MGLDRVMGLSIGNHQPEKCSCLCGISYWASFMLP